jgi:hypothetical protein
MVLPIQSRPHFCCLFLQVNKMNQGTEKVRDVPAAAAAAVPPAASE